jgi:hypothetical protein
LSRASRPEEEPASEGALEAREGVAAVDQVVRTGVGIEGFAGSLDGQGVQVVAEDFGAEVLLGSQPGHAGQMFEGETMLDPFEQVGDILPNNTHQPKS